MTPRAIEDGLVAALRALPEGEKPRMGELRAAVGCTGAELKGAVERLRYAGKLHWDRLELAPSMLVDASPTSCAPGGDEIESGQVGGAVVTPAPGPTPAGEAGEPLAPASPISPIPRIENAVPSPDAAEGAGPARPAPSIADQVKAEAAASGARRRKARVGGSGAPLGNTRALIERIQTGLVEEPADLIRAIQRRHASLLDRIVALSRARDETPGASLFGALELGIVLLERETRA